jgi:hypothetical protein
MKISRDDDGLRFIGECAPKSGFVAWEIQCVRCERRVDPHAGETDISLKCLDCKFTAKVFWSEADLHVYLAEHWGHLRKACTHPTVTVHGSQ